MSNLVPMAAFDVIGFSYETASMTPEEEAAARAAAGAIRSISASTIPEVGKHLIAAKAVLPHGTFGAWAEAELGISSRSAQSYMAAAGWLEGKPATVALLPPTILYALSAKAAPAEVVQHVVEQAEGGAPLSVPDIRDKLANARMEELELRQAQRRTPSLTTAQLRKRKEEQRRKQAAADEETRAERAQQEEQRRQELMPLAQRVAAALGHTDTKLFVAEALKGDNELYRLLMQIVDPEGFERYGLVGAGMWLRSFRANSQGPPD